MPQSVRRRRSRKRSTPRRSSRSKRRRSRRRYRGNDNAKYMDETKCESYTCEMDNNGRGVCTLKRNNGTPGGEDASKYHVMVRKTEHVADQVDRLEALLDMAFSVYARDSADQGSAAPDDTSVTPRQEVTWQDLSDDIALLSGILSARTPQREEILHTLLHSSPYTPLDPSESARQRKRIRKAFREEVKTARKELDLSSAAAADPAGE